VSDDIQARRDARAATVGLYRVLLVEDEEFTRAMVASALEATGHDVRGASSVAEGLVVLEDFEPHVIIADLDLGSGPSGADLLHRVAQDSPWVGLVVLTAHAAPALALPAGTRLPDRVVYLIKSQISSGRDLQGAMEAAIADAAPAHVVAEDAEGRLVISRVQGEILRLIAEGYSNQGIAEIRGTSMRATESLIHRTFVALGLGSDKRMSPRVQAVRMWQQGRVSVR
jgi:DNA-binding NarL/FixJ family response regulator